MNERRVMARQRGCDRERDFVAGLAGPLQPQSGQRVELSQGHPWLVNALADQVVNRDEEDRSVAVTAAHVEAAKETLIAERRTHIDSLVARLREPRVRKIIEPMLLGEATQGAFPFVHRPAIVRPRVRSEGSRSTAARPPPRRGRTIVAFGQ